MSPNAGGGGWVAGRTCGSQPMSTAVHCTCITCIIQCVDRVNSGSVSAQSTVSTFLAKKTQCSARDWDGKDYLRIIPRVVW